MQFTCDEREAERLLRLAVLGAYVVANGGGVCEEVSDYEDVKEKLVREYLRAKGAGPALTELQAELTAERALEKMRKYLDGYEEQSWQWKLAEKLAEAECPGNRTEERLKRQELYEWVLQEEGGEGGATDLGGGEKPEKKKNGRGGGFPRRKAPAAICLPAGNRARKMKRTKRGGGRLKGSAAVGRGKIPQEGRARKNCCFRTKKEGIKRLLFI